MIFVAAAGKRGIERDERLRLGVANLLEHHQRRLGIERQLARSPSDKR